MANKNTDDKDDPNGGKVPDLAHDQDTLKWAAQKLKALQREIPIEIRISEWWKRWADTLVENLKFIDSRGRSVHFWELEQI
jgi:hypothetical protein